MNMLLLPPPSSIIHQFLKLGYGSVGHEAQMSVAVLSPGRCVGREAGSPWGEGLDMSGACWEGLHKR
jgi:hypothetical protein